MSGDILSRLYPEADVEEGEQGINQEDTVEGRIERLYGKQELEEKVKQVLLVGAAADVIMDQIGETVNFQKLETIDEAVDHCLSNADEGDILLLSPACASFDQFESYEARGDHFRALITDREGWTK